MNPIEAIRNKAMIDTDSSERSENQEIHDILVGEIAAEETYAQALEKIDTHPEAQILRNMLNDHKYAVNFWKNEIKDIGERPERISGAWGEVAQALVGTAKILGDATTLVALKKGEEHGLNQYKKLLEDESLDSKVKERISLIFIPNQEKHIQKIDSIIES